MLSGKMSLSGAGLRRPFDVRGTRDQSLLFGPPQDHSEVSEFGMYRSIFNGVTATNIGVGSAVRDRNSSTLHRPKPIT